MVKYLEAHQGSAKYVVAAVGSTAGAIALQSGRNVIDMGGFMGADPATTLAQVEHLIDTGQLHYILLGGQGGGPGGGGATSGLGGGVPGGSGAKGGPGSGGTGGGSGSNATVETRDRWIEAHGTVVHVSGQSTSGSGATLYYFAR